MRNDTIQNREEKNKQLNALLGELKGILPKYGNSVVSIIAERHTTNGYGNNVHVKEYATLDLNEGTSHELQPIPDGTEILAETVTIELYPFPDDEE